MGWIDTVSVGDWIRVQIVNPHGDRNLDGDILYGTVKEYVRSHNFVRLDSGWCAHGKDRLLERRALAAMEEAKR